MGSAFCNFTDASAQGGSTLPCYSIESVPGYLRVFMNWARLNSHSKAVTVKGHPKSEQVLATVIFQSFQLKSLRDLLNTRGRNSFSGLVDGKVNITGTCRAPVFTGDITVSNGYVRLLNFGEQSFENVEIDTSTAAGIINRFDSLRTDLNINIGDDFYVRNKRFLPLKIRLTGELSLKKEMQQTLRLKGTLKVTKGYIKPLGTRFHVNKGVFHYTGELDNPEIYISSLYEPHRADLDIEIYYRVEGTIEDPVFKFSSDPAMELKNIFSYILFGQPFYRLDTIGQNMISLVSTRSAADRTADILINRVETIATQKLSVDVVRIDNTTAESGTVITTGWYLKPKVFFAIQNIIAGRPRIGFYLEYYLTENLKLILSQDDDYGQGIDLQYEYDY